MFKMDHRPEIQLPPTPVVWLDGDNRWAYRVVESAASSGSEHGEIPQSQLDELGADGWELAAILPRKNDAVYYFKRLTN